VLVLLKTNKRILTSYIYIYNCLYDNAKRMYVLKTDTYCEFDYVMILIAYQNLLVGEITQTQIRNDSSVFFDYIFI